MNLVDSLNSARKRVRAKGWNDSVSALNRTWSLYSRLWDRSERFNKGSETLGDEWGGPEFADLVVAELAAPYLREDAVVLELGCGGGKFSKRLANRCGKLICTDISKAMLKRTAAELQRSGITGDVEFVQLSGADFAGIEDSSVDFIFSYDVQLHLQPQNNFAYLLDAKRILRPGGVIMLHQINLASPGGIEHFQEQYGTGTWRRSFGSLGRIGHIYYSSRDQMTALSEAAGLEEVAFVDVFPEPGHGLSAVNNGRDLVGFYSVA